MNLDTQRPVCLRDPVMLGTSQTKIHRRQHLHGVWIVVGDIQLRTRAVHA